MSEQPPARILVVDDDAEARELLKIVLEDAGYEVGLAPHGGAALEQQRLRPADLLITDIFMPEKEGIETIEQFHAEYPGVRIIAVSGGSARAGHNDYLSMARQVGAAETLRKPFDFDALLDLVKRCTAH